MGGGRSHECRFNEFKVLVLHEAPCLCTLGQRHCVQIKVGARLIQFVFRELNIAAVEYPPTREEDQTCLPHVFGLKDL